MEYIKLENVWSRICPQCHNLVKHKNRAKCMAAEKREKTCATCSRSNIGKKNSATTACPICNTVIRVPTADQTEISDHALQHGLDAAQLWCMKNNVEPTTCACGCGSQTQWINWKKGYNRFIIGHNANIYSSYDEDEANRLATTRGSNWRGKESHWKGKTKETDDAVRLRAIATSKSRRQAFKENRIRIWSKGKTKDTDERLCKLAKKQKERFASGELQPWTKGLTKANDSRVARMAHKVALTHSSNTLRKRFDEMKRHNKDDIIKLVEHHGTLKLLSDPNNYTHERKSMLKVTCIAQGHVFEAPLINLKSGRCLVCDPIDSQAQIEIKNFIKSLGFDVTNNRQVIAPLELDIWVPAARVAIEYNGLYFHSVIHKSSQYHNNKTMMCKEKNVKLFHVFEDEWRDKQEIVRSMIATRLGVNSRKIAARKCCIVELPSSKKKCFFETNHLDGNTPSKKSWGLQINDKIVAAVSVRKPIHKAQADAWEIARLCSKRNTVIVGGISKLLKHVSEQAQASGIHRIISYLDTRFGGTGKWYEHNGFVLKKQTDARFWWTDFTHRYNRFKYRADSQRGLTEAQIAEEAGVHRIYGCSNLLYELQL